MAVNNQYNTIFILIFLMSAPPAAKIRINSPSAAAEGAPPPEVRMNATRRKARPPLRSGRAGRASAFTQFATALCEKNLNALYNMRGAMCTSPGGFVYMKKYFVSSSFPGDEILNVGLLCTFFVKSPKRRGEKKPPTHHHPYLHPRLHRHQWHLCFFLTQNDSVSR